MTPGATLKTALDTYDIPVKSAAVHINYSTDAVYSAIQGKRKIPKDAMTKLAGLGLLAGLAVAHESTGYSVFNYHEGDRHIQSLIQRVMKEDFEADQALQKIVWMLLDKEKAEDLTPEQTVIMKQVAKEILDRINWEFNLLVEFDSKFKLGIIECLTNEKHGASRQASHRV